MKVCTKCEIGKDLSEFNKGRGSCKLCVKEYDRVRYLNNIEKYRKYSRDRYLENPEYLKTWNKMNKDKIDITAKKWRDENKEKSVQYTLKWRSKNVDKYNQYMVNKRNSDPIFKLSFNVRKRIGKFLKTNNLKKNNKTFDIVELSPIELKSYLEKKFTEGMSWDNYGEWHIDHIKPLSSATNEGEVYKLCHYNNLQPLWAEDNIKKSNKILINN